MEGLVVGIGEAPYEFSGMLPQPTVHILQLSRFIYFKA